MVSDRSGFWKRVRKTLTPASTQLAKEMGRIVVVSGLPRSGTSMMMKMLEAGGVPALTDEIREADPDNPRGYYEFERVKRLDKGDTAWLDEAYGKAVKVIATLLTHLPANHRYKVIFMRRSLEETLQSQKQMLVRRGEPADRISDEEMATVFRKHLGQIEAWIDEQPYLETMYVSYNDVLEKPVHEAQRINRFLGKHLDVERMIEVVDPNLYRQRHE